MADSSILLADLKSGHCCNTEVRMLRLLLDEKEGSLYSISGFDVPCSNVNFKLSDSNLSLTSATCFSKRQYSSSWVLADAVTANYCLADIFGELTEIRSTLNEDLQSKVRVIATIKIQRLVSLS
ncbi:hypothetical protein HID58_061593 [Brassica napus]|uniref:Uncharacterized protein n=1 Tax=Brassica napus TaxID=3708 RepID=A0ABQ7ZZ30_BRANA|nr:hypothetical protein HID58_061593 [Brassica napus]